MVNIIRRPHPEKENFEGKENFKNSKKSKMSEDEVLEKFESPPWWVLGWLHFKPKVHHEENHGSPLKTGYAS